MKIIDWTHLLKTLKNDPSKERFIIELIKNDFNTIRESVFKGDQVIIRFIEGLRIEVQFIYEIGRFDLKKVLKDFNRIREYNQLTQQMLDLADEIRELLKNYPEKIKEFDEYINSKLNHPLFEINFVLDNKVFKSVSGIPYDFVETYIEGFLLGYKLDVNPEET